MGHLSVFNVLSHSSYQNHSSTAPVGFLNFHFFFGRGWGCFSAHSISPIQMRWLFSSSSFSPFLPRPPLRCREYNLRIHMKGLERKQFWQWEHGQSLTLQTRMQARDSRGRGGGGRHIALEGKHWSWNPEKSG